MQSYARFGFAAVFVTRAGLLLSVATWVRNVLCIEAGGSGVGCLIVCGHGEGAFILLSWQGWVSWSAA